MKDNLHEIFLKYQEHPDFYGVKIIDVNQKSIDDDTMLHMASRNGALEDIERLILGGADVDAIGDLGNTPLHQAALFGQLKSAALLLKYKAKATIRNEFNQIPADIAKNGDHNDIANLITSFHPIASYPAHKKNKK